MIPSVNFIDKQSWYNTYGQWLVLLVLLSLVSAGTYLWQSRALEHVTRTRATLSQPASPTDTAESTALSEDRHHLREALNEAPHWSMVVGELYATLPQGVILSRLEKRAPLTLRLSGTVVRDDLLPYWITILTSQTTIAGAAIISTATTHTNETTVILDLSLRSRL